MSSAEDWTAIGEEIQRDDAEAIRARLENGLDLTEPWGGYKGAGSILQVAAGNGSVHVVQCLIEAGADVNKRFGGWTALMSACESDRTEVVRVLLDAGANPNIQSGPDDEGDSRLTALMEAAEGRSLDSVKMLLAAGADPTLLTRKGRSALNFVHGGHQDVRREIVRTLVEAGCPVVGSCLVWPAEMGDVELTRYLLQHGADPNLPSNKFEQTPGGPGELPIHIAIMARWMAEDFREMQIALGTYDPEQRARYLQVARELIEAGADVNLASKGLWVIRNHRLRGDREVMDLLLSAGWQKDAKPSELEPCRPSAESAPAPAKKLAQPKNVSGSLLGAKDFIKYHYSTQPDWSALAVLAPIEVVSEAFARYRNARSRTQGVAVHPIPEYRGLPLDDIPVVQLKDNPWTVLIRSFQSLSAVELADVPAEARALSEELGTRAVTFMGEDTSGVMGYELYENGVCVEKAEWDGGGDNVSFESSLREKPRWPKNDIKVADAVLGELGIYIPICYAEGDDDGNTWLAADKKVISLIDRADLIDI